MKKDLKRFAAIAVSVLLGIGAGACLSLLMTGRIADAAMEKFSGIDMTYDRSVLVALERCDPRAVVLDFEDGAWVRMLVAENPRDKAKFVFYAISSDGSRIKKRCLVDRLKLPSGELDVRLQAARKESRSLSEFWRSPHLRLLGIDMRNNFDGPSL